MAKKKLVITGSEGLIGTKLKKHFKYNYSSIYFQTYTPNDEVLLSISKNNPYEYLNKEL